MLKHVLRFILLTLLVILPFLPSDTLADGKGTFEDGIDHRIHRWNTGEEFLRAAPNWAHVDDMIDIASDLSDYVNNFVGSATKDDASALVAGYKLLQTAEKFLLEVMHSRNAPPEVKLRAGLVLRKVRSAMFSIRQHAAKLGLDDIYELLEKTKAPKVPPIIDKIPPEK